MNAPDHCPTWAARLAERRELIRRAAWASIERANSGQSVDPLHLQWARDFVTMNPPLDRPLGTGEPQHDNRA